MGYKLHYNPSTGTISYWPKLGVSSFTGVVDAGGLDITWPVSKLYTQPNTGRIDMDAGSDTCTDDTTNYLLWSSGAGLALGTTAPSDAEILVSTITTSGGDIADITAAELIVRVLHIMSTRTEWKLFRVASEATGDGLYTCRIYDLDATDWANEAGTSKIVAVSDVDDYVVLNLAEFDPESVYVAHLAVGDIIFATQLTDDESNSRWVGIPLRKDNADRPRMAYCSADASTGKTIAATLDTTNGTAITVHCEIAQAGTDLDDAQPRLKDNDIMFVSKIWDGTHDYWRCLTVFQPTEDCVCS